MVICVLTLLNFLYGGLLMTNVPYIDYHQLNEFYTIAELCKLFQMQKSDLKSKCKQYGIEPRRNEIGEPGFVNYDVRKLHNLLYYENREHANNSPVYEDDLWA